MTFDAIYETDNTDDGGYRQIEAASLKDAKAVLKAQIVAEGTHGAYRLDMLVETAASFAARRAVVEN